MRDSRPIQEYKHVVHVTEEARRAKFQGCVSRQTLRSKLRKSAQIEIRKSYPKMDHASVRQTASVEAREEFRRIRGLSIPEWRHNGRNRMAIRNL
jgi:hypothetical protein